jgi:hypothetical protein
MDAHSGIGAIFPVLMVVVFIVVIWLSWYFNKKRREAAQAFARERGWTYTAKVPGLTQRWQSAPFARGHSRRAFNVLTGAFQDMPVVSFAYQYTTGSGKNQTTHYFHVVALSLPARLPWLRLSADGAGASVAKFFGGQDIRFESKAFNDAWRVQSADQKFAYDFIHPRMMDRLMAPDAVGRTLTVEDADIVLTVAGRQALEAIDGYVNLLYGVYQQIPRHLWLNVGYDPLVREG